VLERAHRIREPAPHGGAAELQDWLVLKRRERGHGRPDPNIARMPASTERAVRPPLVSVIIRARDEQASIGRCLELIAQQRDGAGGHGAEVILVDAGSVDRTAEIAQAHGARVVELPARSFTFGRGLNLGAANARGEILVALSAHAFIPDPGWLARLVAPFADPGVACVSGDRFDPDGAPLAAPLRQDLDLARRRPEWGYSNAAGAFRAELWRRRPFRDDLPGCEDKEWAWYWLERGYVCVVDPGSVVDHDHTHDNLRSIYRRARREAQAFAMFAEPTAYGPRELGREWWSDLRWYSSPARARFSHRRAARLLGVYAGRRRA
jgi:rhamnosyltransferase